MTRVKELHNWCMLTSLHEGPDTIYRILGELKNHPRHLDGAEILTSRIVEVNGRMVSTRRGSQYQLGEPDPGYLKWIQENIPSWDPENPLRGQWKDDENPMYRTSDGRRRTRRRRGAVERHSRRLLHILRPSR